MARPRARTKYVRQMPRIYGNLQPKRREYFAFLRCLPLFFWSLVGIGLVYGVLFSGFFSVKHVEVEGAVLSDADQIRSTVPLGSSLWFISKKQIADRVSDDPAVDGVAVLRGLPDSVKIVVSEKKPAMVWQSGPTYYVLDADGVPFLSYSALPDAATPIGKTLASVPLVRDDKALPVRIGRQPAGGSFVTFVAATQAQVKKLLPTVQVLRFEVSDTTYDVTMFTKQGMEVQFNSLGDAGVQSRNLARLVQQNKANLASSMVDLRVDRWAYVSALHP